MAIPVKYVLPLFFLIIFVGAMILGPLIYFALGPIYPVPFHRAMDRGLLISAVAALGLFWPRIALRKFWPWNRPAGMQVIWGYAIAFVSAQGMIGFYLAFTGFTRVQVSAEEVLGRIAMALVAAIVAPFLEETIFRGFLQTEFIRVLGRRGGWLFAGLIFMIAHFLKIPTSLDYQEVHWWSGITAVGAAFHPVTHGDFVGGKGLNLLLLGLILGALFLQTGTLWLSASLHSGWVFVLLLFTGLTQPMEPPIVHWLRGDLLSSPVTSVVLLLLSAWLWRIYHPPLDE